MLTRFSFALICHNWLVNIVKSYFNACLHGDYLLQTNKQQLAEFQNIRAQEFNN
jgi:hypothetical protein